jgi:single-strand DNA-binding protein
MISATVTGGVGRDAELRQPQGGDQCLSFSVASRRYQAGQEATDWVAVTFWGKRAAAIASHVTKGSRVAVRGTLYVREYEHGGKTRHSLEMRADDVELLGGTKKDGHGDF